MKVFRKNNLIVDIYEQNSLIFNELLYLVLTQKISFGTPIDHSLNIIYQEDFIQKYFSTENTLFSQPLFSYFCETIQVHKSKDTDIFESLEALSIISIASKSQSFILEAISEINRFATSIITNQSFTIKSPYRVGDQVWFIKMEMRVQIYEEIIFPLFLRSQGYSIHSFLIIRN